MTFLQGGKMLSFISGTVAIKTEDSVVIDNNGIGYELSVSRFTLERCESGARISLFCHMNVREDAISLYGFWEGAEKQMFLKLVSVSGVGPKVAFAALSGLPFPALALAILTEDIKTLSKIKGLGKKTAERIVVDLKEKVSAFTGAVMPDIANRAQEEAIEALTYLGFSRADAVMMTGGIECEGKNREQIITEALQGKK